MLADIATRVRAGDAEYSNQLDRMRSGIQDAGNHWHGSAYDAAYDRIGTDCDTGTKTSHEVLALSQVLDEGCRALASHLSTLNSRTADAENDHCSVADDWAVTGDAARVDQHSSAIGSALTELIAEANATARRIRDAATAIRACGNQLPEGLDPSGAEHVISPREARDQESAEAFHELFGRYPQSPSDWQTATALNPHSYTEKYQGIPPSIKVVRIEPVPGQGVVRTSSFIEPYSVFNVPAYDLGDNRPNDPEFDPEYSRVTTFIDYENGLVVMRQNPSVDTEGNVKVGSPDAEVWQAQDGSVRLKYEAANPFRPEVGPLEAPAAVMPTVHGDVVFTPGHGEPGAPGSTGVTISGTRADYPSFEVYQDDPRGTTHTVAVDPAKSGESWGPALNLWTTHGLGSGERALEPFQYIQEWGGRIPPTVRDLPGTVLGDPADPPRVN
ncbi:hypothetical protein FK531_20415 [Rhodococcus spelaei]|uniref:Uncharacterized protein n=1 Tax=Rhodococcus spelaei TaxID=2546320 RepID=A0A541B0E8_9NOCA|nr:hypothetical protein [Rhodococcus spelaei]TQF65793.1 hypothetical protein FK531_20415 [Rhodococcus spelaei]